MLFVDDEPNILQATRRATRPMRDSWDMHFVESGEAALEIVAANSVDVVVSDMRMPGMDGAELLNQLRAISPATARIILSGYAEEEAILRSTRVAHQFLSKPCDLSQLKQTIEAIRTCREAIEPEAIRDLVGKLDELPALGDVYSELIAAIDRDTSSNESLGRIVSQDVALTAELLRLVNSAFFGLSRRVESVSQAIGFLGFDVVRGIVAGHSLFSGESAAAVDVDEIGRRSQATAALARTAFRLSGGTASDAAEAYLAGMLHEVGVLVLADQPDTDPESLRAILASDDITNERLTFGADRFCVGGYLLGLWGFSPSITNAINALAQPVDLNAEPVTYALRLARETVHSGQSQHLDAAADNHEIEELLTQVATDLQHHTRVTAPSEGIA